VVPLVAAVSLVLGFAIAQGTGIRWLGAIILLVGGAYCAATMWPVEGPMRTGILAVVYVAGFALSHPLARVIGTWSAVLDVACVVGLVGYAVMRPSGSRVSTTSPPDSSTR
jgi:hypothetical protein